MQSGGILGILLRPIRITGLPLMKNVLKPFAKSVLILVWLTTAADAAIQKKFTDHALPHYYTGKLKRRNERYHENS